VHHLLTLAEQTAGMPPVVEGFAHEILKRYREYLTRERGVKPSTIRFSIRQARRTLSDLKARNPDDLRRWSPERLRRHVVREVQGYAGSTSQATTSRIRVFLSFLAREESIAPELATSVSTVPFWRRAMPRPPLADQTIKRLMSAAAADRTPQGLRNHAIILCLSELGIRASDLVGLELDGLDCAAGTLRLRHIKDRQETELPMSRRLASALKTYIKQGRPKCVAPWVFVHHRAPTGKQLSSHGVRDVLGKLSVSAGLPAPIQSTHAFRRAFAGRMLQAGASLKQIADVLGHQSINTTVRYTHTDIQALAKVALPWPATREALP
jgi:site-specific recombinase XerD